MRACRRRGRYDFAEPRGGQPIFEDELAAWQEKIDAARRANERLGPQAAERAKQYDHLTLEQVMARWAEVMSCSTEWASDDDFEIEVMAVFSVLGVKMQEGSKVLRDAGFECGEPMQQGRRVATNERPARSGPCGTAAGPTVRLQEG